MKNVFILVLCLLSLSVFGQTPPTQTATFGSPNTATGIKGTLLIDSSVRLPVNTTFNPVRTGSARYDTVNKEIEIYDQPSNTWNVWPYGGGGGGSMVYPGAGIPVSTGSAWGTSITDNSTNWNTAYSERNQWDGSSTGLNASTGRTSLGGTTIGQNLFTLTNPSALGYLRANADNTITHRSYANVKVDLGLNNVENTALSTWTGSTAITTLGTITTGTWGGGTIPVNKGGTGATSITGIVIADGTNPFTAVQGSGGQLLRRNAGNTAYEFFTPTYLTSYTETDPIWSAAATNYYTKTNVQTSGQASIHWDNISNEPAFITDNIYNANGTLGANRTVTMDGKTLSIVNGSNTHLQILPATKEVRFGNYGDDYNWQLWINGNQGVTSAFARLGGYSEGSYIEVNENTSDGFKIYQAGDLNFLVSQGNGAKWMHIPAKTTETNVLYYNESTGYITYGAPTGGGGSGTVNTGAINRLAYYNAAGNAVDDLAAITGNRALTSDANGLPVASSVTDTELGYVSGVTSSIQTQLGTKQATLSGTGLVKSTSGTISYITDNSTNWDDAYNNKIVSAAFSGTTTKTLTLTQQDGGTVTANFNDDAGGGSLSLGAVGSSPNANAATLTGSTLNLEPASAAFPGVVTTGTQTWAGEKGFNIAARFKGGAMYQNLSSMATADAGFTNLYAHDDGTTRTFRYIDEAGTVAILASRAWVTSQAYLTSYTETDPVVAAINGIVKSNGTTISAAAAGTDYVAPNSAITGATKTKITYDTKGLVTAGADLSAGDIPDLSATYATTGHNHDGTYQPLDADLTTIAGLTATTDNFIVSVSSAWASRTPAQVKTTLALNNVENTALSTWAGSSNITTLGTIASGTWGGTDISNSAFRQSAGLSVVGRSANTTGDVADITGTDGQVLRVSGTTLGFGSIAQSSVTNLTTDLGNKQPLDADLTTIAGLTATTDNFLVGVSSAWASRTPAQVRTTLGLTIGTDVQAFDTDLTTLAGSTGTKDNTTYYGGDGTFHPAILGRAIMFVSPTATENVSVFYTPHAITITGVQRTVRGTSPSVTYVLNYGTNRESATGTIVASNTATTTGSATLNTTSIPAGSYIWVTTSAVSGTIDEFGLTVNFRQ